MDDDNEYDHRCETREWEFASGGISYILRNECPCFVHIRYLSTVVRSTGEMPSFYAVRWQDMIRH